MHAIGRILPWLLSLVLSSCATLGQVIQPPAFEVATDQQAELRLLAPSPAQPLGGAAVRLWTRVSNPNPFGLTLSMLTGQLALEGTHAAQVAFPLGLPLMAGGSSVVPLEISINFADVPNLARVLTRAVTRQQVGYQLTGRVGVNAGVLGQPTFGPITLLTGSIDVLR
jgi:hypothetical protein